MLSKRRANGEGNLRKRSDGRWEGRIVVGHKENGDSIFRYIYADTQKELTTKLRQNIQVYQGVDLTEQSKVTLAEWLDIWLDQRMAGTIRSHTLEGYRRDISNHIKPYLGQKRLTKLTSADLKNLYALLLKSGRIIKGPNDDLGLSPTTVRGIHSILHHALKTATKEGLIPSNPASKVVPPKMTNRSKGILNNEQLDALMEAITKDELWHDCFYTELTTGLRWGKLCGLKWEDFDSKAGTLKICCTIRIEKGGKLTAGDTKTYAGKRTILLPHSTIQLLKKRKETALTEWIFLDLLNPEKPTHPAGAYRQLKKLLVEAGLPDIRFHDLRHPYVKHKTKIQ